MKPITTRCPLDFDKNMASKINKREHEYGLPFPYVPHRSLLCLYQTTFPRQWCIKLVTHKWFDRFTMLVILLNCVLMGMYRPCEDEQCTTSRCKTLEILDNIIFGYFALEMVLKVVAFGLLGKKAYLSDSWNRLDCFIVVAGLIQYVLESQFSGDINLTAIRTIRVLRPIRAVNRIPSLRVVVTLLLDTMPMVVNVLVLCGFVFFIFGIIAVQLWNGGLRNRCVMGDPYLANFTSAFLGLNQHYLDHEGDEFLCSLPGDSGIHTCHNLLPTMRGNQTCNESVIAWSEGFLVLPKEDGESCVNWNQYYNTCAVTNDNPMSGSISFDNIAMGWVTIFVIISLEGWADIMYFIQDTQSFWTFIYFVILIVIGSFFMVNLFLVVISCQFAETRKRETARMLAERGVEETGEHAVTDVEAKEWELVEDGIMEYGMYETVVRAVYKALSWCAYRVTSRIRRRQSAADQCLVCEESQDGRLVSRAVQTRRDSVFYPIRCALKTMVQGNIFRILVMVAILMNTVALALEHHNQPESWTTVLEYCNLVFTIFFAVEMLIKLLALGVYEYFIDPFNTFDAIIVLMSIVDIVQEGEGQGLSVLRTFRLLRVIKLIRFLPALRHQLGIMIETLDEVAVFFILMALFVFIFSLMGMVLFGGKFCSNPDTDQACDCTDFANGTVCECSRMNFDTFPNASLTVFQILTTEDWNEVLFTGMLRIGHWASLYFISLMTVGNYILLNLLVAILVDGVHQQQEKEKIEKDKEKLRQARKLPREIPGTSNSSQLRVDTATVVSEPVCRTPHAQSMCSTEGEVFYSACVDPSFAIHGSGDHNRLGASTRTHSFDDDDGYELRPLDKTQRLRPLEQCPAQSKTEETSLISYHQTYTEARKRSDNHGDSVFAGMRSPDTDSGRMWKLVLQDPPLKESTEKYVCEPEYSFSSSDATQAEDGFREIVRASIPDQVSYSAYLSRYFRHGRSDAKGSQFKPWTSENGEQQGCCCGFRRIYQKSCFGSYKDRTFFVCSRKTMVRSQCVWLVGKKWFDNAILCLIFLNCITMAMERPSIAEHSVERQVLQISNYVFTTVFAVEMMIKVIAHGLIIGDGAYLKDGWNVMDGLLVVVSSTNCIFTLFPSSDAPEIFNVLRVFRILRALRPLRVINRAPGLKLTVQSLMASFKDIANVLLICFVFFVIFGILGVQLFKGTMYHCQGPDITNVTDKSHCLLNPENQWENARFNYDDLGQALLTLFVMSTLDGWVVLMHQGIDAVGIDQQPKRNHNQLRILYFLVFLLIVGFFVLNMFVGVLVENFQETNKRLKREAQEEKMKQGVSKQKRNKTNNKQKAENRIRRGRNSEYCGRIRARLLQVVEHSAFQIVILVVIVMNVIVMATTHYQMSHSMVLALDICNFVFTTIFTVEAALKIFAMTFCGYISDNWNKIDFLIVIVSLLGLVFDLVFVDQGLIPINPGILRILRVIRIARGILLFMKLLKSAKGIRCLLDTVSKALPQVGNLGLLFFLLFFIFAALGVELFGRMECSIEHPCDGLSEHAHFKNFGMAFLTLFRISTGDNWNGILKDTLREDCDDSADCERNCCISPVMPPIYFVLFVMLAQFVLLNVVVAMLMKGFEDSSSEESSQPAGSSQSDKDVVSNNVHVIPA